MCDETRQPIATINIYDPSEIADPGLDLLTVEKIVSLRVEEIIELGAAYREWRDYHRNHADDYHQAVRLCAEALYNKGVTENYQTERARVQIKQYAIFEKR